MSRDPDDRERLRHCPLPSGDEDNGLTYADPSIRHPSEVMDGEGPASWAAAQASWVPRLMSWLVEPLSPEGVAARVYVLCLALGVPTGWQSLAAIAAATGLSREQVSEYARRLYDQYGLSCPGRRSPESAERSRQARLRRLAR
jgi:hypothetical protein